MSSPARLVVVLVCALGAGLAAGVRPAQAQDTATLRVTVLDQTEAALIDALVTVPGADGQPRQVPVDGRGVATLTGLPVTTLDVSAEADGFRTMTMPVRLRRGDNQATLRLPVAVAEQIEVGSADAAVSKDDGFTTTLSQDEVENLSDDPDEMADQLAQMAGPGAQIVVDGFRGGRLPPKDQIERISFRTNMYAAEHHEAGMVRVEVSTRPGMGNWRSRMNFGFRDGSLNARNAFADEEPVEQVKRFQVSSQGPIVKGKTSLTMSAEGSMNYDAQTLNALTPEGAVTGQVRRPNDAMNFQARLEQSLGTGNSLRAEYSRRSNSRDNLGVGDFELEEHAYSTDTTTDQLRVRHTKVLGKKAFSELKVELTNSSTTNTSLNDTPTIQVLDAFTGGGAGQYGTREAQQLVVDQGVDFTVRKHALKAGVLLEGGWWNSNQQVNPNGTFVFSTLSLYEAGQAQTYTQRVGDPQVDYSMWRAGWYLSDDFRITKNLNLSLGLRQELQTQVGDKFNLAPRTAFAWTVDRKTTVRGGWGLFYDWFDSSVYEQTLRVDGTTQRDLIVVNPTYPFGGGTGDLLPSSRIQAAPSLGQALVQQASLGVERNVREWLGLRADYMWTRGYDVYRAVNVNAPIDGVRPDPTLGNVTQVESTGKRSADRLMVAANLRVPNRRIFGNVMYQLGSVRNMADGPLALPANSLDPDADWGPSAQDIRHRVFFMVNLPLPYGLRGGLNSQYASARPYNIITGVDNNGDTVFNDRLPGVGRNSQRGASTWNVDLRLTKSINLGGSRLTGGPEGVPMGGPPPNDARGVAAAQGPGMGPGGGPGGGDGGPRIMVMEANGAKYRLDLYASITNLLNRVNYNAFIGNLRSPFFGEATSAAPARRLELGATFSF